MGIKIGALSLAIGLALGSPMDPSRYVIGTIASVFVPLSATGGTVVNTTIGGRGWRYHIFNNSADFVVSALGTDTSVSYLAVGGGGAGAHHDSRLGMGGGSGGMVRAGSFVPGIAAHAIVVGNGGVGVSGSNKGNDGGDTTGFGVTAERGRGGAGYFTAAPTAGVNGGGGGCTLTVETIPGGTGSNFRGGNGRGNTSSGLVAGGGGAGAGGQGGDAVDGIGGAAGPGVASTITGVSVIYGAGAGGSANVAGAAVAGGVSGVNSSSVASKNGTDGLGNGGSGSIGTGVGAVSGYGGKGVFIVGYWTEAPFS